MKNKKEVYNVLESLVDENTFDCGEVFIELDNIITPQIIEFAEYYFEKQLKKYKETSTILNDANKAYLEWMYETSTK
jgi:hypothetical protein